MGDTISSRKNTHIQYLKKLISSGPFRHSEHRLVLEGVRLVEEAARSDWHIDEIYYSDKLNSRGKKTLDNLARRGVEIVKVSESVMATITDTETPQGVVALVSERQWALPFQPNLLLILDAIRDPGNMGTILRTALAAGVDGVIVAPESADPFSPKVLRSGMGAQFQLPVVSMEWKEILLFRQAHPEMNVLLADTQGGQTIWEISFPPSMALIISNEATGSSQAACDLADGVITVPMPGGSESLNAAIAAAVIIYEILRQRPKQGIIY